MLGRRYDARTLERWNVINRVVADEQLDPAADDARARTRARPHRSRTPRRRRWCRSRQRGRPRGRRGDGGAAKTDLPLARTSATGVASFKHERPRHGRFRGALTWLDH